MFSPGNTCISRWNFSQKLAVSPWNLKILRSGVRLFLHETKYMGIFLHLHCTCISESMSVVISLIYNENNTGPRMVPWGTPDKTGSQSDFIPFTTTCCCLKQRKESIHFRVFPPIPYPYSLNLSSSCRGGGGGWGCIKSFLAVQDQLVRVYPRF